jgi:hypothetical protein
MKNPKPKRIPANRSKAAEKPKPMPSEDLVQK